MNIDDRRVATSTTNQNENGAKSALLPFVHSAAKGCIEPILTDAVPHSNDSFPVMIGRSVGAG